MNDQKIIEYFKKIDTNDKWFLILKKIINNEILDKPLIIFFNTPEEYFNYLDNIFNKNDYKLYRIFQEKVVNYYFSIKITQENSNILYRLLWIIASMRIMPEHALRLEKQFLSNKLIHINKGMNHIFLFNVLSDFSEFGIINKENIKAYVIKNISNYKNKSFISSSLRYFINNEADSDFFLSIENLIPRCSDESFAEILFSLITEIAYSFGSYFVVYKWVVKRWDILSDEFPEQMNSLRLQLMKNLNYQNEDINNDKYIKPIIGIINSKSNQLPAMLIADLQRATMPKYVKDTFNLRKRLSFHMRKIAIPSNSKHIIVTFDEGSELMDIENLYKIDKKEAISASLNNNYHDKILAIKNKDIYEKVMRIEYNLDKEEVLI